ncbi:MAG TPA: HPr family phosphocarrier protein [Patescibacteria group bacterium]|nr:HPr family phosphocarrier protein [Patescibacteria group bacterium]
MEKLNVTVESKCGLHARPASMVVSTANKFNSNITLKKKDRAANAKSIMGVLSIAAANGDELEVIVEGQDEAEAANALENLFKNQLPKE